MPLSWNETQSRALAFSRTWADAAHLGYGLGLSIVGSIARQHGASFTLTSPVPGRSSGLQAMLVFPGTD